MTSKIIGDPLDLRTKEETWLFYRFSYRRYFEVHDWRVTYRKVILMALNEVICPLGDRMIRLSDGQILEDYKQENKPVKDLHW